MSSLWHADIRQNADTTQVGMTLQEGSWNQSRFIEKILKVFLYSVSEFSFKKNTTPDISMASLTLTTPNTTVGDLGAIGGTEINRR